MEILAPAGSFEVLKAAINAGCHAVYISGKNFGARKYSPNFTNEELKEAIIYAHLRNVKVYVTVNTLIYDEEMDELISYLSYLESIKVDALIVQDLGVISLIRTNFPNLTIHASTQMNINSPLGAKKLKELGVKRVVLAREVPLDILKEIIDEQIEVEVFVHGALCFSYSGLCLLSYFIGERSGNKGSCAQPCRKKYQLYRNKELIQDYKALLSMKDLCTIDYLDSLEKLGVASLKIEGRMKSESYVYSVVSSYVKKLKKESLVNKDDLYISFNREFTKGYLFNEQNCNITNIESVNHQGLKIGKVQKITKEGIYLKLNRELAKNDAIRIKGTKELGFNVTNLQKQNDLTFIKGKFNNITGDVFLTISGEMKKLALQDNFKKFDVDAFLFVCLNEPLKLELRFQKIKIEVVKHLLTEKTIKAFNKNRLEEQLLKSSSDVFKIKNLTLITDYMPFIKVSEINEIRNEAFKLLEEEVIKNYEIIKNDYFPLENKNLCIKEHKKTFEFIVQNKKQYDLCKKMGFMVYTSNNSNRYMTYGKNLKNGLVHNFGDIKPGDSVSPSCNIVNEKALSLLENYDIKVAYLSNELKTKQIKKLASVKTTFAKGIYVYGFLPAMITKHCFINKVLKKESLNCLECQNANFYLVDEFKNKLFVKAKCEKESETIIHSFKKTDYFAKVNELYNAGISHFLVYLTDEDEKELENIFLKIKTILKNGSVK